MATTVSRSAWAGTAASSATAIAASFTAARVALLSNAGFYSSSVAASSTTRRTCGVPLPSVTVTGRNDSAE
jgi:hypothetical protein